MENDTSWFKLHSNKTLIIGFAGFGYSFERENSLISKLSKDEFSYKISSKVISDIAVMLANGITVPAYTTYTEKDYKYLIEDCQPSVIIVSNDEMHDKLKNIIEEKAFIRK